LYYPFLPSAQAAEAVTSSDLSLALAALRLSCKMSVDVSCRLHDRLMERPLDFQACAPPSAAPSCHLAILEYAGLARLFPDEAEGHTQQVRERFESPQFFCGRRAIAQTIMRQLEEDSGLHRVAYLGDAAVVAAAAAPPTGINMIS
jgi:hypothetical protein